MEEGQVALPSVAGKPFVGRARDLAELRAALDEAVAGNGSLVLVAGEPGIGKTRLAEQVAAEAASRGVVALWGRAWEGGGAPPFWPWVQVFRQLFRQAAHSGAQAGGLGVALGLGVSGRGRGRGDGGGPSASGPLDPGVAAAVRLVPELAERVPEPAELAALGPKEARFWLFDGAATLLAMASETQPLLVVLDDLHWADVPSLLLLQFVARELHGVRLLLLGTYRDVMAPQPNPGEELATALGGSCQRIMLRGLDRGEVTQLLALTTGAAPAPALGADVRERTGGNPLFVREVARLLAAGIPGVSVPEGVQAVLGQRLGLLSPACVELLAVAAVLGREPRLDLLQVLAGRSADETVELLGEAVAARLVEEVPGVPPRWRFTHALVREVLYAGLSPGRRLALHQRAGEAIEARFGGDLEGHMVELADHFLRAGPAGAAKAVGYSTRAGVRALQLTAWEEAAGHLQRALDTLELAPVPDLDTDGDGARDGDATGGQLARRCELELALADARMAIGEVPSARAGYERAAALARRLGDPESLAHAALGLGGEDIAFQVDEPQIRLLEEALGKLTGDSLLRARVLARLARALMYTPALERRVELCDEALAIARRVGDPATLAAVLCDRHTATWGVDTARRQLVTAPKEVIQLAETAGDRSLVLRGRSLLVLDLLELGKVTAMRAEIDAYERGARELRQPHLLWPGLCMRITEAIIDGRFEEAERYLDEELAMGQRAGDYAAAMANLGYRLVLGLVIGDLAALEGPNRQALARHPGFVLRALLMMVVASSGRLDEAREEFDRLATNRFAALPRDTNFFISLLAVVVVAYGLGDGDRATVLYQLLQPYDGQVLRFSRVGGGCLWTASHHLGLLATTMGRHDLAVAHFEAALQVEERMGALPYLATTRYYYALALRHRGQPGDEAHAARQLDDALVLLRRFGIRPLFAPADLLEREAGGGTTVTAPPASAPPARVVRAGGVLRQEGEYWTVGWQGNSFRLRDTIGLAYLTRLLTAPGRELHALDLVAAVGGERGPDEANLGPLLDEQAKRAYRQRLQELDEELAEAEGWHDQDRTARARTERDALAQQLAAALGLGGRDRNAASGAERARVSVTKALRGAIRRIGEHDPALGEHLQRSVRTGSFCAYDPDPDHPVTWELS